MQNCLMSAPTSQVRRQIMCAFLSLMSLAPSIGLAQETAEQLIVGKWRHISLVRVIDGHTLAPQQSNGEAILEFKADGTWSGNSPNTRSAGTYRFLKADMLEQTVVESNLAILIGQVNVKQVRVDNQRLNLIIVQRKEEMEKFMPPAKPGVRRPNEVIVTTIFSRVPPQ